MTSITLSIVIPTYNRRALLDYLLDSIIGDFPEWPHDLELVVLDNASDDGTDKMLADRLRRGARLRTVRQPTNIGMDGNLAACFGQASGTYFWQIGDDELLFAGTANWVLQFCRQHVFGLLHLSSTGFDAGGQEQMRSRVLSQPVRVVEIGAAAMVRQANVFLTFISANVVNKKRLLEHKGNFDPSSAMGTHLPQLAWIYDVLSSGETHYRVLTPSFAALADNTGGYRLVEVFCVHLPRITRERLGSVFPEAAGIIENATLLRLLPGQLNVRDATRLRNFVSENVQSDLDRIYGRNVYYRLLVRHVAFGTPLRRRIALLGVRLLNLLDRATGDRLL